MIEIDKTLALWFSFLFLFLFILSIFGAICNLFVVNQNGGRMPVYNSDLNTNKHFGYIDNGKIAYPFLSDIIKIGDYIFSIGDIFIIFSILFSFSLYVWIVYLTYTFHNSKKQKNK